MLPLGQHRRGRGIAWQHGIHPPEDDDELIGWWVDDYQDRAELGEVIAAVELGKVRPDLWARQQAAIALVRV